MDPSARPHQPVTSNLVLVSRSDFSRFYDTYAPQLYGRLLGQGYPVATAQRLLTRTFNRCWQERDGLQTDHVNVYVRYPLSWLLHQMHQISIVAEKDPNDSESSGQKI